MTRLLLTFLFFLPILLADDTKLQLQSILITPNDKINETLSCSDIQSITFDSFPLAITKDNCYGTGITVDTGSIFFIPVNNNATFEYRDDINFTMVLYHVEDPKAPTLAAANWNQTLSSLLKAPTDSNKVISTQFDATIHFPGIVNKTIILSFNMMKIHTEAVTQNNNTQAVVVAVIEGLLLGAILVVFIYRQFFSKKRQQQRSNGGGFPTAGGFDNSPAGGAGNAPYAAGGGNYYDNAAVAYRQNNGTPNAAYGYDQPSIRLEDRRPASQAPADTGRVQVDSPALVPVPLGNSDPLQSQWGDQRSGTAPDRLFT